MPLKKLTAIFEEHLLVPVERALQSTGISGYRIANVDAMIVYQLNGIPGSLDNHIRLDMIALEEEAHQMAQSTITILNNLSARTYMVFVSPIEELF